MNFSRATIYFSIDDDLIYPKNYVELMLDFIAEHDYQIIVSAHGRVCRASISSYYKDKLSLFHFEKDIDHFSEVHFGGTGVMAFSTKHVKIKFEDLKHPNMADIWLGLFARNTTIPILVIPHHSKWIIHSEKFDVDSTIFRQLSNKANVQISKVLDVANSLLRDLDFSYIYGYDLNIGQTKSLRVLKNLVTQYRISSSVAITVAIPSFNRRDLLIRLINQLDISAAGFVINVVIFDDGSEIPVNLSWFDKRHLNNIEVQRFNNHGKKRYWSLVNNILDTLSAKKSDYYFYLGDDLEVKENFFYDAINSWESISDNNKISLNLLIDSRTKSWTDFERVKRNFSGFDVYQTQWLDMIMIFDEKLLSHRLNPIPISRWKDRPLLSSGVGAQLSGRFHESGYGMYQVVSSLVYHGEHDSEMNPEERRINKLTSISPEFDSSEAKTGVFEGHPA
jgi:hypothetical protein